VNPISSCAVPEPLAAGEAHVWLAQLSRSETWLRSSAAFLTTEEAAQCERYIRSEDRARARLSRSLRRAVLSRYLGCSPERLQFACGEFGKPRLDAPRTSLEFNIAHSGDWVLLAVGDGVPIGVDVEEQRPLHDHTEIAERFFSCAERAALRGLPKHEQQRAFFVAWTRKEAVLKALGTGLSTPLDSFDVELRPNRTARLVGSRVPALDPRRWTLADVDVGHGYAAAVAAAGPLRCGQARWRGVLTP
jgi:4'-phosphopantetheinyl transferase